MERKKKWLIIGGFVVFVITILVISIINIVWNNTYSVTIDLLVAPADSEIFMNNEPVRAGLSKVKPGEYEFLVARDGFEPQTQNVTLNAGENKQIYFALVSNDPSTADWYATHPEDAKILEGISSWAYSDAMNEMESNNSILEDLPVYAAGYVLGYGNCSVDGGSRFCVVIKANFGFRDAAVKYLRGTGKDLAKYYVTVEDYRTPFSDYTLTVPDGLEFSESEMSDAGVLRAEMSGVMSVANARIANLRDTAYSASILQIKDFGNNYCVVKVKVTDGGGSLHDTYRMILAKVDGNWRVVSDLDFLLNYADNPKLPRDLVKLANEF